jgi:branched-chain amino acid transport system substrate-binding protein
VLTEAFYWDQNDKTRDFSKRFAAKFDGKMPTSSQAGVYGSVLAYLETVAALKSKDTAAVMKKIKETTFDDPLMGQVTVRADGRAIHPMYLFEVKKPAESKGPWDMYKTLGDAPRRHPFTPGPASRGPGERRDGRGHVHDLRRSKRRPLRPAAARAD